MGRVLKVVEPVEKAEMLVEIEDNRISLQVLTLFIKSAKYRIYD